MPGTAHTAGHTQDESSPGLPGLPGQRVNGMRLVEARGSYWPPFFPRPGFEDWTQERWLEEKDKFVAKDDDVVIAAYAKSGHHWSFEFINMLLKGKAESTNTPKQRHFFDIFPPSDFDDRPSPRVICTHLEVKHFPQTFREKNCKMIYIVRNPKDVAVSDYHHVTGVTRFDYSATWEEFLPVFMRGELENGSWSDHVGDWYNECKKNPNFAVVFYEDLKKDFVGEMKRLADFFGKPQDDELFKAIDAACNINVMRDNPKLTVKIVRKDGSEHSMFRKGIIGDWKTKFTVAQSEMFDFVLEEKMKDKCPELLGKLQYE